MRVVKRFMIFEACIFIKYLHVWVNLSRGKSYSIVEIVLSIFNETKLIKDVEFSIFHLIYTQVLNLHIYKLIARNKDWEQVFGLWYL